MRRFYTALCLFVCFIYSSALFANGLSLFGKPKYGPEFDHFDYVNPDALKGGPFIIGLPGTFDSLNPYTAKGIAVSFINSLVFQTLAEQSQDEPFSMYPLLAKKFELSSDRSTLSVELDEDAEFSDGKPVTTADVKMSFELFRSDKVDPSYKTYWADIKELQVIDKYKFKFILATDNHELPLIALQMPILPAHIYGKGDFARDFTDKAIGSGPYIVKTFKKGSNITYNLNEDYWAAKVSSQVGRFNFGSIGIKYYRDMTVLNEGFKKNEFDYIAVTSSKSWAKELTGTPFDKKWIRKELLHHDNNQGSQGFYFNLRNPLFKDREVRKAIAMVYDFEWANKTLFYSQYTRSVSFFENSELKAVDPIPPEEKKLLKELMKKFPKAIPSDLMDKPMGYLGAGLSARQKLRKAMKILKKAGYKVVDGVMTGPGGKFEFNFVLRGGGGFERVVEPYMKSLKRIGVKVNTVVKEASVYARMLQNREFDMTVLTVGQSQSPGNEQIYFWGSKQADEPLSRNYYGLKNDAVDYVIEKIIASKSRQELVQYTRALDRILYNLHITVHNWYIGSHRVAYWKRFSRPEKLPKFYSPFTYFQYMSFNPKLSNEVDKAKRQRRAMRDL